MQCHDYRGLASWIEMRFHKRQRREFRKAWHVLWKLQFFCLLWPPGWIRNGKIWVNNNQSSLYWENLSDLWCPLGFSSITIQLKDLRILNIQTFRGTSHSRCDSKDSLRCHTACSTKADSTWQGAHKCLRVRGVSETNLNIDWGHLIHLAAYWCVNHPAGSSKAHQSREQNGGPRTRFFSVVF